MRSGDVRWVSMVVALAAGCEHRAPRQAPAPVARDASRTVEAASAPAGSVVPAPPAATELPGCAAGWWPLADGQRWRWRIERAWIDLATGQPRRRSTTATIEIRAAGARAGRPRHVLDGWPAPWTDALTVARVIEREGATLREVTTGPAGDAAGDTLAPWIDLGPGSDPPGLERRVIAAAAGQPAVLELAWRSMADHLTLRLACGVGPWSLEYAHHGTLEELRAVREPARSP